MKMDKLNGFVRIKIGKLKSKNSLQTKLNHGLKTGKCLKLDDPNIAEISGTFQDGTLKVIKNAFHFVLYYFSLVFVFKDIVLIGFHSISIIGKCKSKLSRWLVYDWIHQRWE